MFDKFVQWLFYRKTRAIWVVILISGDDSQSLLFRDEGEARRYAGSFVHIKTCVRRLFL